MLKKKPEGVLSEIKGSSCDHAANSKLVIAEARRRGLV